jgi:hypothetical protein|tara:strand:+ start:659 stop:868 length:210 start_codon:yes stop_codon:yes gene_type:complete
MTHPLELVQQQMNNPDIWAEPQSHMESTLQFQMKLLHRAVVETLAGSDKAEEMFASSTRFDKNPRKRLA